LAIADRPDLGLDPAVRWLVVNRRLATFADARVCHFDFSPGNILLRWGGSPTVVDWDMASLGDPSCDLAFTLEKLTLVSGALPRPARPIARLLLGSSDDYLRAYSELAPVSEESLRYWRALYCVLVRLWSAGLSVGGVALMKSSSDALRRLSLFASERFRALTNTE
jgi:aminoglycoside phosphotransferase (APT) family kinase protein